MADSRPTSKQLLEINPDGIRKNPDNPRMIFREDQMNELLESIAKVGIQVPITVYEDRGYVILDGERRWRCSKRLNLKKVPCIVHPKPSKLENLLMMFNIHNVRVQWDIMPTAYKLGEIRELLGKAKQDNSPRALSAITGVRPPTVKRCLELLELPKRYRDLLMSEAEKPKGEQTITADLFIEINKAYNVVEKYVPETLDAFDKPAFVDSMVGKYRSGTISSVTAFRNLSKLARAELAGVDRTEAIRAIRKLVRQSDYSVDDAFRDTVQTAYDKRDLLTKVQGMSQRLVELKALIRKSPELKEALLYLRQKIDDALS
jgi:ParB family transcriptional regulator, chromosome partitioning protein